MGTQMFIRGLASLDLAKCDQLYFLCYVDYKMVACCRIQRVQRIITLLRTGDAVPVTLVLEKLKKYLRSGMQRRHI